MTPEHKGPMQTPEYLTWNSWATEWLERHKLTARTTIGDSHDIDIAIDTPRGKNIITTHFQPTIIKVTISEAKKPLSSGHPNIELKAFGNIAVTFDAEVTQRRDVYMTGDHARWEKLSQEQQATTIAYLYTELKSLTEGQQNHSIQTFVSAYYEMMSSSNDNLDN